MFYWGVIDMYNLAIAFEETDTILKTALNEQFGNIRYDRVKNFDGLNIFVTAIIPISALTVQVTDFILTHFTNRNDSSMDNDNTPLPKRLLIDKEGNIDLTNYSADEAVMIIKAYFESQDK